MKYLKQIGILTFALLSIIFSVESGHTAEDTVYTIENITATTTQTLEMELNNDISINSEKITSDLRVYKDISVEKSAKDISDAKKVKVSLNGPLSKGNSYSILSISGVEGSIEFKLGEELDGVEINNSAIEESEQGIEKINIIDANTLDVVFLKALQENDFEFKVYRDIEVDVITMSSETKKMDVLLKDSLEDNAEYVGTVTLFEGEDLTKIDIDGGIYDFSTEALNKYDEASESETTEEKEPEDMPQLETSEDEESLEEALLNALGDSESLNLESEDNDELLEGEQELNTELNSAAEDPANAENTQLEDVALGTKETPDTGAETWILLLGTFIINTFYYFSRRKRLKQA